MQQGWLLTTGSWGQLSQATAQSGWRSKIGFVGC